MPPSRVPLPVLQLAQYPPFFYDQSPHTLAPKTGLWHLPFLRAHLSPPAPNTLMMSCPDYMGFSLCLLDCTFCWHLCPWSSSWSTVGTRTGLLSQAFPVGPIIAFINFQRHIFFLWFLSLFLLHRRAKTHMEINNIFICSYTMLFFSLSKPRACHEKHTKTALLITKKIYRFTNGLPIIAVICKGERDTHILSSVLCNWNLPADF